MGGEAWVRSLSILGTRIFVGRETGAIDIFDTRHTDKPMDSISLHSDKVLSIDSSQGLLVSGGADHKLNFFKL